MLVLLIKFIIDLVQFTKRVKALIRLKSHYIKLIGVNLIEAVC